MINESYKNRIQKLAGIINEDAINLTSKNGRSGEGTLSWYSEDYLLDLGSKILTELDNKIESEETLTLQLFKGSTKMQQNSIFITTKIVGEVDEKEVDEEFEIAITVQFSDDSNTVASVTYRNVTNKFNLSSKHSADDLSRFIDEVVNNIINSIKISNLNPKS
jgi:hypothetical protein